MTGAEAIPPSDLVWVRLAPSVEMAAALAMVPTIVNEGIEALRGERCEV